MESALEELKKKRDEAWEVYNSLDEKYNQYIISKIKEHWKGKFVKIHGGYMWIYEVWNSDLEIYLTGIFFKGSLSQYMDDTYFAWDQHEQVKLDFYDFSKDTLEHRDLVEIGKEEFEEKFKSLLDKVKEEQGEFNYEI